MALPALRLTHQSDARTKPEESAVPAGCAFPCQVNRKAKMESSYAAERRRLHQIEMKRVDNLDRIFQMFLDVPVGLGEEKVLVAPLETHDDRWINGIGEWSCEIRRVDTEEIVFAKILRP